MSFQGLPRPKHMWYIVMRAAIKGTAPVKGFAVVVEASTSAQAILDLYQAFDCIGVTRVELEPRTGYGYRHLSSYVAALKRMQHMEHLSEAA